MLAETTRTDAIPAITAVDTLKVPERSLHCRGRAATRERSRVLTYADFVFAPCIAMFPLLFMVFSSFKEDHQIFADLGSLETFLPTGYLSLDNYSGVFERVPAVRFIINSLIVTVAIVLLGLIVNSMIGFAISRTRWRGKNIVLSFVLATLMILFETITVSFVYWVVKLPSLQWVVDGFLVKQGMLNTYRVQILPFVANALPIFLLAQYPGDILKEINEVVRVDGVSWRVIYSRIIVLLSDPIFATVAIITVLPMWNSYLWSFVVIQEGSMWPAGVGMQYFFQLSPIWGQIMAYSTFVTLPVLITFVLLRRSFAASLAGTAVKG